MRRGAHRPIAWRKTLMGERQTPGDVFGDGYLPSRHGKDWRESCSAEAAVHVYDLSHYAGREIGLVIALRVCQSVMSGDLVSIFRESGHDLADVVLCCSRVVGCEEADELRVITRGHCVPLERA